MPYPVYSTTFIRATTTNAWTTYTVPAGYRAVVKKVTAQCFASGAGHVEVMVAGVYAYLRYFQAAYTFLQADCFAVAWAGEVIQCYNAEQLAHSMVSGFLLREVSAELTGPPVNEVRLGTRTAIEHPELLPAELGS